MKIIKILNKIIINIFKYKKQKKLDCYNCIYKTAASYECLPPDKNDLQKCYVKDCQYFKPYNNSDKLDEIVKELIDGYRSIDRIIKGAVLVYPNLDINRFTNIYKQELLLNNRLISKVEINKMINKYSKELGVDIKKFKSRQFALLIIDELKRLSDRKLGLDKTKIIQEIMKFIEDEAENFDNYIAINQFEEELGRSREDDINLTESLYRLYLCIKKSDNHNQCYYKSFDDFIRLCDTNLKEKLINEFGDMMSNYANSSVFLKSVSEADCGR